MLRAVEMTPRHLFVPTGIRHRAYDDAPLPIGNGQTISQPLIHAQYLELLELKGTERVLEIGTGTGYQTALLSQLVAQVFSIERIAALNKQARAILEQLGLRNVSLLVGDGTLGWREHAPFDAILVSAGSPSVPQPLLDQLADGGRLLVPIGDRDVQQLVMYRRRGDRIEKQTSRPCDSFRLIGKSRLGRQGRSRGEADEADALSCHVSCEARCRESVSGGSSASGRGRCGLAGLRGATTGRTGSVEVQAEGDQAAIDSLLGALRAGPSGAQVLGLEMLAPASDDAILPSPFAIER